MPNSRLLKALTIAAAALCAPSAWASGLEFDALMKLLSQRTSGQARFVEERHVVGLDKPLRSAGRLTFEVPDRFGRHVETPKPESIEVEGQTAVLRRGNRVRQVQLDTLPELQSLVEAIRGTLSGNGNLLRQHFQVQLAGGREQWTLSLRPLDERALAQVSDLIIAGQQSEVRSIELRMGGGDRSVMTVDRPSPLVNPVR